MISSIIRVQSCRFNRNLTLLHHKALFMLWNSQSIHLNIYFSSFSVQGIVLFLWLFVDLTFVVVCTCVTSLTCGLKLAFVDMLQPSATSSSFLVFLSFSPPLSSYIFLRTCLQTLKPV